MALEHERVLLIIGAGGGTDLGLPTNIGLLNEILSLLNISNRVNTIKELESAGFKNPEQQASSLYNTLLFGAPNSIDSVLMHRPDLVGVGKYLIAKVLTKYETDKLFMPYKNPEDESYEIKSLWFRDLLNLLRNKVEPSEINTINPKAMICNSYFKKMNFITFNYEKTFPYYMYQSLQSLYSFDGSEEAAFKQEFKRSFLIEHAYGQLGYLPFQEKEPKHSWGEMVLKTSSAFTPEQLRKISEEIIVVRDLYDKNNFKRSDKTDNIGAMINRAEKIVFLGFSFHKDNLRYLQLCGIHHINSDVFRSTNNPFKNKKCYGTCFGMSEFEKSRAKNDIGESLETDVELFDLSIKGFIREKFPHILWPNIGNDVGTF